MTETTIFPIRCWCALTPDGSIIPWTCSTDRERVLEHIRSSRLAAKWRPIPVTITADKDDE